MWNPAASSRFKFRICVALQMFRPFSLQWLTPVTLRIIFEFEALSGTPGCYLPNSSISQCWSPLILCYAHFNNCSIGHPYTSCKCCLIISCHLFMDRFAITMNTPVCFHASAPTLCSSTYFSISFPISGYVLQLVSSFLFMINFLPAVLSNICIRLWGRLRSFHFSHKLKPITLKYYIINGYQNSGGSNRDNLWI